MFKTIMIVVALGLAPSLARADEADFYGRWKITASVTAPWADPAHPMVTDDVERYGGQVVDIAKGRMTGPDLLGCGATKFSVEALPYAGLFEGGLAADGADAAAPYDIAKAKTLAASLGFAAEPVESLFQGCSEIVLHRMNDRTLSFGLDNRIFTLEKQ